MVVLELLGPDKVVVESVEYVQTGGFDCKEAVDRTTSVVVDMRHTGSPPFVKQHYSNDSILIMNFNNTKYSNEFRSIELRRN